MVFLPSWDKKKLGRLFLTSGYSGEYRTMPRKSFKLLKEEQI
jgi:hypothetical protein